MGPALGPAAALLPLPKMAPSPLQRGGHAKPALGSLPPASGSTGGLGCAEGKAGARGGLQPLWKWRLCGKGDTALLLSSAPQGLDSPTRP